METVITTGGYPVKMLLLDMLRRHEEHDAIYAIRLSWIMRLDGVLLRPLIVEERSLTLLDGHHRLAALTHLGCRYAPCVLLDYDDARISLEGWRPNWPVCREIVLRAAAFGPLLPHKTSRHTFSPDLGEVNIGLEALYSGSKRSDPGDLS